MFCTRKKFVWAVAGLCFFAAYFTYASVVNGADEKTTVTDAQNKLESFLGIDFGVGISSTFNMGQTRINDAKVLNNVIRVEKDNNVILRPLLETHYFFPVDGVKSFCKRFTTVTPSTDPAKTVSLPEKGTDTVHSSCGFGPFIAIAMGTNGHFVDGLGFGLMFGGRMAANSDKSFNIGLGAMLDPYTKVLGDGLREGDPVPSGDQLRYKETNAWGLLLMASFTWGTFLQ